MAKYDRYAIIKNIAEYIDVETLADGLVCNLESAMADLDLPSPTEEQVQAFFLCSLRRKTKSSGFIRQ